MNKLQGFTLIELMVAIAYNTPFQGKMSVLVLFRHRRMLFMGSA